MKFLVFVFVLTTLVIATTTAASVRDPRRVSNTGFNQRNSAHAPAKYPSSSSKHSYNSVGDSGKEQILRNDQVMMKDGAYRYDYETSNGIAGNEQGVGGVAVQGSSSYISPEGVEVKMSYTADETGYHPVGDHIPQIPDYILRALEYIRTHPYVDTYSNDGAKATPKGRATPKISTSIAPPHRTSPTAGRSGGAFKKNNAKNFGRG